jgi:hypothetical protein
MKNQILILILISYSSFSQNFDKIKISNLNINGNSFSQTSTSFQNLFGSPSQITTYFNEISNKNWLEYKYSNNSFYFDNNTLIEFQLKDNQFYFQNNNIKVGNNVLDLSLLFPNSYNNRSIINELGFIRIEITFDDDNSTDIFIIINYDRTTNNITSIHSASS